MRALVAAVPSKAWSARSRGVHQIAVAAAAASAAATVPAGFPEASSDVSAENKERLDDAWLSSRWTLREFQLPGERAPLEVIEGRFVFQDGTGVHVWPAATSTISYLRSTGLASDKATNKESDNTANAVKSWKGRKVLELGCGCGFLAIALSRLGSSVVAVDTNEIALALAEANVERNRVGKKRQVECRSLDWSDLAACEKLRSDLGPFDAIVVSDGVLTLPPSGAMWHVAGAADVMISPAGPLLDATRTLGQGGAEVIVVVVDRAGECQDTARALLDRRHWLELVGPPRDIPLEDGTYTATVFHFRWKPDSGTGGEVAKNLWSAI